jgi:transcriptional regulator with XRE-family HTH domain
MVNPGTLIIIAKKYGVLMRGARLAKGKSVEECAEILGVPVATYEAYEYGDQALSLPQLEALAFFLNTTLDYFWDQNVIFDKDKEAERVLNLEHIMPLRQRMIGVMMRKARLEANLSVEQVAECVGIPVAELEAYEMGEKPIDLPQMELIARNLKCSITDFQDQSGPVGRWLAQHKAIKGFLALPVELQGFVSKPVNQPYLEVAQRLSAMSTDRLRGVAEGLLEITL